LTKWKIIFRIFTHIFNVTPLVHLGGAIIIKTRKWIAGWLLASGLVVGLAGCGGDTSTEWDAERRVGGVWGIVNDSLALIVSSRCYITTTEYLLSSDDEYGCSHSGLHLVNYRTKQTPLWNDTLDYGFGIMGQISDSVVYGGGVETQISFWKIGSKPISKTIKSWSGTCSPRLYAERVRPWKNGTFIVLGTGIPQGGDSCQYATLDTATGKMEMSRFTGNNTWLKECEDIRYLNEKALCLKKVMNASCGLELMIDGNVEDSLRLDSCTFLGEASIANWHGHYINVDIYPDSWIIHKKVSTQLVKVIDGLAFDSAYSHVFLGYNGEFFDSAQREIRYVNTDFFGNGEVE
jgi:hypothetical protein